MRRIMGLILLNKRGVVQVVLSLRRCFSFSLFNTFDYGYLQLEGAIWQHVGMIVGKLQILVLRNENCIIFIINVFNFDIIGDARDVIFDQSSQLFLGARGVPDFLNTKVTRHLNLEIKSLTTRSSLRDRLRNILLRGFVHERLLHFCSDLLTTWTHALLLLSIRIVKTGIVLAFVEINFGHDLELEMILLFMVDVTSLFL